MKECILKSEQHKIVPIETFPLWKEHNEASDKVKVGVLIPVQQPGSHWDRSSALSLVVVYPTQR